MAGDWIKVREDLHEDPAVLHMAAKLETRPEHVVGYCVRFWAWVSRNCHAHSVTNVTLLSVESVLDLPGFLQLLVEVGWLEYDDTGQEPVISIPHYERHLSQSSKARALTALRQRHARVTKASRCERDEIVTREEKRRVKKNPPNPPLQTGGLLAEEPGDQDRRQEVDNVVAYWVDRVPAARPDERDRERIANALAAGFNDEQISLAILGYLEAHSDSPLLRGAIRDAGTVSKWITAALKHNPDRLTTPDVATELERGKWRRAATASGKSAEWIDEQCKARFGG